MELPQQILIYELNCRPLIRTYLMPIVLGVCSVILAKKARYVNYAKFQS